MKAIREISGIPEPVPNLPFTLDWISLYSNTLLCFPFIPFFMTHSPLRQVCKYCSLIILTLKSIQVYGNHVYTDASIMYRKLTPRTLEFIVKTVGKSCRDVVLLLCIICQGPPAPWSRGSRRTALNSYNRKGHRFQFSASVWDLWKSTILRNLGRCWFLTVIPFYKISNE